MLVRKYSVISIIKDMWRDKAVTIITVLVCVLLGVLAGFLTYRSESSELTSLDDMITAEPSDDEPEYVTQLRNYEESMAACQEAYDLAVEGRDNLQVYIDNSILMKVDPDNVQIAYAAYEVQDSDKVNEILSALQIYINDGDLKEDAFMEEDADDLEIEGWKEVVWTSYPNGNLGITVNHYDSEKAKRILDVIQKCVENQYDEVSKKYGSYKLVLIMDSAYSKVDSSFSNVQNGHLNDLRGWNNAVSDQLNKINDLKTKIDAFKEKNEVTEGDSVKRGLGKTIVLYGIIGLVAGIVVAFVISMLRAAVSNKIQCADHLAYSGLTIINKYRLKNKEFASNIKNTVNETERIISNNNDDKICLYALSDDKANVDSVESLKDKFEIKVFENDRICDCNNVIIVLTCRKDLYSTLEETMAKVDRLGINLLGIVVNE